MPWRESGESAAMLTVLRTNDKESHKPCWQLPKQVVLFWSGPPVPSYLELPH